MQPISNDQDYKATRNTGYKTVYGQAVRTDTDGLPRGYTMVEHAIDYAGINLPTV